MGYAARRFGHSGLYDGYERQPGWIDQLQEQYKMRPHTASASTEWAITVGMAPATAASYASGSAATGGTRTVRVACIQICLKQRARASSDGVIYVGSSVCI